MSKAILVLDMPSCCNECFALDEYGDCPLCLITKEQKGYTFKTREQRMDKCPLKPIPEKQIYYTFNEYDNAAMNGWNECIDTILEGYC